MADTFTPEERTRIMAKVRGKNTKPEMIVRRLAHGMGYRYRLHRKDLPGCPDLTFPGKRKAIFVHGCFWHGHDCRAGRNRPSSNIGYWQAKLERNTQRDRANMDSLTRQGWDVLTLWECEIKDADAIKRRLAAFLG